MPGCLPVARIGNPKICLGHSRNDWPLEGYRTLSRNIVMDILIKDSGDDAPPPPLILGTSVWAKYKQVIGAFKGPYKVI